MLRLIILILLIPFAVHAARFSGEGFGADRETARANALSDLASQLSVKVSSEFSLTETSAGKTDGHRRVDAYSDLPVLGAEISYFESKGGFTASAVLNTEKSLPMYEKALNSLADDIRKNLKTVAGTKGEQTVVALETAFAKADNYEKILPVARLLGSEYKKDEDISSAEIAKLLEAVQRTASTFEDAAFLLTRDITQKSIYVFPPSAENSHEITPFAAAVQSVLSGRLASGNSPDVADYHFSGEYTVQGKEIILTYRLVNRWDGTTLYARTARLLPAAFAGLDYKPKTADFDALLYSGLAVSNDFRVDVSTNKGSRNLLFKRAESVEILVKTTAPAYVYVIGHTVKKGDKLSYLLEFQNAQAPGRFIRFINADDANKWVSLGEFSVTAPYGVESLQVIASAKDPSDAVPLVKFDGSSGLYIVNRDPSKAVTSARALVNSGLKKQENAVSEAVLLFTTAE